MIKLTGISGCAHYVAAENVARVTEAGASSQWHGIRAIVRTFDGAVLECQEEADTIVRALHALSRNRGGSDE